MISNSGMNTTLHITSGDCAGSILAKTGISGEILVWHDVMYEGPRAPGWPNENVLLARAEFLEQYTAGGLKRSQILDTLRQQYEKLAAVGHCHQIILWFDGCLFDQSMLAHILTCLHLQRAKGVQLLCINAFPGIERFNGLGQLTSDQMASLYGQELPVSEEQYIFAELVDKAFANQDFELFDSLARTSGAPLPYIPAAVKRWLEEQPDPESGLGRLETIALEAIRSGCETPGEILRFASAADIPPQFWGDITLWGKINSLASRIPPLVKIEGPTPKLPQWPENGGLTSYRIISLREP